MSNPGLTGKLKILKLDDLLVVVVVVVVVDEMSSERT